MNATEAAVSLREVLKSRPWFLDCVAVECGGQSSITLYENDYGPAQSRPFAWMGHPVYRRVFRLPVPGARR